MLQIITKNKRVVLVKIRMCFHKLRDKTSGKQADSDPDTSQLGEDDDYFLDVTIWPTNVVIHRDAADKKDELTVELDDDVYKCRIQHSATFSELDTSIEEHFSLVRVNDLTSVAPYEI